MYMYTHVMSHTMLTSQNVQRTMENRQVSSSELAKVQREMVQLSEYMRKQQLEYQEALSSLQRKVGRAQEMEQENLKIHQQNVNLMAELEDYRHQTKTLLTDLHHKEEEIASLKQNRSQFGSNDVSKFIYMYTCICNNIFPLSITLLCRELNWNWIPCKRSAMPGEQR